MVFQDKEKLLANIVAELAKQKQGMAPSVLVRSMTSADVTAADVAAAVRLGLDTGPLTLGDEMRIVVKQHHTHAAA